MDAPAGHPVVGGVCGRCDECRGGSREGGREEPCEEHEDKTKGPAALFYDPQRRFATQSVATPQKAWLLLSMQPSTGDGGTCYGDSGGPHFLGGEESNLVVSITVTGDAMCRATDKTYRLDTPWSIEFLARFID